MAIRVRQKDRLEDQELIAWLRLIRSENVGPITFHDLIAYYGSAEEALRHLPTLSSQPDRKVPLRICSHAEAEREIEQHRKRGFKLLTLAEKDYPVLLAEIDDAPPVLSIRGDVSMLSKESLGIVGARNASMPGRHFAQLLAQELGHQGWWITSGLARGVDTSAHEGALSTGTTAVLGSGVDYIYPYENEKLYHRIAEKGCIISEAPLGSKPHAGLFPRRNRIISGLSRGVIVVEAALKSGSLITARLANEQGRDVFAVPGSPFDPRCRGTNVLIQQGAHLIQCSEDVMLHYDFMFSGHSSSIMDQPRRKVNLEERSDALRKKVMENLSYAPISLDALVRQCQTTPEILQGMIIELELAGRVLRSAGGQVSLAVGA